MTQTSVNIRTECPITIGDIKCVLAGLPDDSRVVIGVRDPRHCDGLLGEMPVEAVSIMNRGDGHAIVLDVSGLS